MPIIDSGKGGLNFLNSPDLFIIWVLPDLFMCEKFWISFSIHFVVYCWRCWRRFAPLTFWRLWPRVRECVARRTALREQCTRRRNGARSVSAPGRRPGSRSRRRATRASRNTATHRTPAPRRSWTVSSQRSTRLKWPLVTGATHEFPTPRASTASGSLMRRRAARARATASTCAPVPETGPLSRAERVRPSHHLHSRWVLGLQGFF